MKDFDMNNWLKIEYSRLSTDLDGLQAGHTSGRDNTRWIARTTGKLDVCAELINTPINFIRIDEISRKISKRIPREIHPDFVDEYREGALDFLKSCKEIMEDS